MTTDLAVVDPTSNGAAGELARACSDIGFFRVPLSIVDSSVADAAWLDAHRFFDLPEDTKNLVAFPEPGYPYGYSPLAFETLAASRHNSTLPDLNESFSVGPDCLGTAAPSADPAEAWLRSPSRWPAEPASLRRSWSAYYAALSHVAADLLVLAATALDLEPDHFDPLIDRHTSALRALHYPSRIGRDDHGARRAGAHSDYGTLTILRTDDVPGLEVLDRAGDWHAVMPEPDTFVVNLGDSFQAWTNDRWRSTMHRVSIADGRPRYSMAFFHMANSDAWIECLPTCTSDADPPRYEPVQAGHWLMDKFHRTVT